MLHTSAKSTQKDEHLWLVCAEDDMLDSAQQTYVVHSSNMAVAVQHNTMYEVYTRACLVFYDTLGHNTKKRALVLYYTKHMDHITGDILILPDVQVPLNNMPSSNHN